MFRRLATAATVGAVLAAVAAVAGHMFEKAMRAIDDVDW